MQRPALGEVERGPGRAARAPPRGRRRGTRRAGAPPDRGLTKTQVSQTATASGTRPFCAAIEVADARELRARPSARRRGRSVQPWYGQRRSRAHPRARSSTAAAWWRHTLKKARSTPSSPRTTTIGSPGNLRRDVAAGLVDLIEPRTRPASCGRRPWRARARRPRVGVPAGGDRGRVRDGVSGRYTTSSRRESSGHDSRRARQTRVSPIVPARASAIAPTAPGPAKAGHDVRSHRQSRSRVPWSPAGIPAVAEETPGDRCRITIWPRGE